MDLVYKFRELYGADMYVGLSPSRMFYPFPWIYRADSYSMDSLDVMQAVDADIPSEYPDGNAWLEETLESAPPGSITLMWVAGVTPLQELFTKKPYLADKVKRMVWMAGAIDVPGNLEPACDSFRCAPYFFPHCTEDMDWCEVCDPEVSGHCTGFPVGARRRIFFCTRVEARELRHRRVECAKNAGMERLRRPVRDCVPVHGDVLPDRDRAARRLRQAADPR